MILLGTYWKLAPLAVENLPALSKLKRSVEEASKETELNCETVATLLGPEKMLFELIRD